MVARSRATIARFPTEAGEAATERDAAVILSGKPLELDTETLFLALFAIGSPLADGFTAMADPKRRRRWLLTELDEIIEQPPAGEPVFWPGDGTANLYTGSRSVRNYRRPDGSMVLAEDEPRVARDGTRYTPTDG